MTSTEEIKNKFLDMNISVSDAVLVKCLYFEYCKH